MGDTYETFDPVTWEPFPPDARFVVIKRGEWPTVGSVIRRRIAPDEPVARLHRATALRLLSERVPEAFNVTYEDIVSDPRGVIGGLSMALGGTMPARLSEVRDENQKWRDES